ncbi:MAG: hypothetical protein HY586_01115, partial [Candidatus Omnitrophica bacterium]|nr:hypothetical protein [Candidatus Omnitrophota bacterium]
NNRGIKNIRSQPVWRTPPTASLESLEEENTPTASSLGMTDEEYERWRAKEFGRQPDFGGGEEFESDEEILPDQSGFFSDADNALFVLVDDSVEEDAELEAKLQKLTAKVENQVREQKWVEARETLLEICRLTPNNESELGPLYYIYKGRILLGQEAWVPALQNFAKASRLIHKEKEYENRESELAGILFCQIRAYYALGDYKLLEEKTSEALEAPYASAFNRQAKFIIRRLRGVARLFLHKYGEAKDDFSTLIQSARNELIPTELEKAYIGLIFANRKLELTSAEEEAFHEALQLATETPLLSIYGAIKSYEEKNWQAVHEALGNAEIAALVMQRPWDLFMVDYVYAELFHALGEDTLAIGLLVVMRLADPLYLPALSLLSRIYWRLGSREQAHSFFRGAEFIKNPQPNALTFAEFQEKMGADSTSLALFSPEVLAYFFRESRAGVISYSWWGERWMKALSRVHNLEARIHYARIALEQCPDFSPIMQVIEKISGTDPLNPQAESLGEPSREAQEFVIDASGGIIGLGRTNTKVTVTEVTVTKVTVTLLGMLSMSENSSQRISIMA